MVLNCRGIEPRRNYLFRNATKETTIKADVVPEAKGGDKVVGIGANRAVAVFAALVNYAANAEEALAAELEGK